MPDLPFQDATPDPEYFNRISQRGLPAHLGLKVLQVSAQEVRMEMALQAVLMAPNGFLHAGSLVTLTNGGGLASATWATANITGPQSSGTWTPKGYATIYVKLSALTAKNAAAGFLNLNFETTTP